MVDGENGMFGRDLDGGERLLPRSVGASDGCDTYFPGSEDMLWAGDTKDLEDVCKDNDGLRGFIDTHTGMYGIVNLMSDGELGLVELAAPNDFRQRHIDFVGPMESVVDCLIQMQALYMAHELRALAARDVLDIHHWVKPHVLIGSHAVECARFIPGGRDALSQRVRIFPDRLGKIEQIGALVKASANGNYEVKPYQA